MLYGRCLRAIVYSLLGCLAETVDDAGINIPSPPIRPPRGFSTPAGIPAEPSAERLVGHRGRSGSTRRLFQMDWATSSQPCWASGDCLGDNRLRTNGVKIFKKQTPPCLFNLKSPEESPETAHSRKTRLFDNKWQGMHKSLQGNDKDL